MDVACCMRCAQSLEGNSFVARSTEDEKALLVDMSKSMSFRYATECAWWGFSFGCHCHRHRYGAISSVFSSAVHLLCRWHINRNALAKYKKLCEMKEKWDMFNAFWNMLVFSSMEDHYNLQFDLFLKEFNGYPEVVNYVINSSLNPYKDRFLATWTDIFMHFRNTSTNKYIV